MSKASLITTLKSIFASSPSTRDAAAESIGEAIYDETAGDMPDHDHTGDAGDGGIISQLGAPDGSPNPALRVDDNGYIKINTVNSYGTLGLVQLVDSSVGGIGIINSGISRGFYHWVDAASICRLDSGTTGTGDIEINSGGGKVGIGKAPAYQLELSTDSAGKPSTNTWTIVSDEKVKKNIKPFTDSLGILESLEPIIYEYNGKAGLNIEGEQIGFNATKEVAKNKANYLFGKFKAKLNEDDEEETELLNYNGHAMPFILRNAVIELKEIIDSQQTLIESQQLQIDDLTKRIEDLEKK